MRWGQARGGLELGPCLRRAGDDRARPRFSERAVVESDELLRVTDAPGESAARLRRRELRAVAVGTSASKDGRDDEGPEARTHSVLVDTDVM